ncbi:MAG: recombinase family protein [Bacteroidota bacterium]
MAVKTKEKKKIENAALYCRVSTVDQGKADFSSLDAQESMLRMRCQEKGWKVYKVYVDTKSGKNLERPELQKMLKDAEDKKFDVVLATKLDRVSRSTKDFLELDERLAASGIDIVITTQDIDTSTPAGEMLRTLLMAFAEFERKMIAERTRDSVYARAQKGYWPGGLVILGYDVVEKKLVVNKAESELVKKIFNLYLEKPSTRNIAKTLNAEGHKTKVRVSKEGKKSGGGVFDYQVVHTILRNKTYIGIREFSKETFKGMHDPIIDDTLFQRVQKRLDESTVDTYSTFEGSPLLLLGTTRCGYCDANLTTYFTNNGKNDVKHYYYKCTTVKKKGGNACPSRSVPAKDLELFTEKFMLHALKEHGFFDAITSQVKNNSSDELIEIEENRKTLSGNLSSIVKKIGNLMENFSDAVVEKSARRKLMEMLADLEKQKVDIESAISELDVRAHEIEESKFDKQVLNQILKDFEDLYKGASIEEKRLMLKTVVSDIKLSAKRGEKDGTLEFKLRGNKSVLKRWDEVVVIKKRGVTGVTPRVIPLRG